QATPKEDRPWARRRLAHRLHSALSETGGNDREGRCAMCRRYVPWLGVALCAAIGFVAVRGAGEDRPTQDDQVKKLAQDRLDVARQGLAAVEKPTVGGAQGYFRATMVWAERVMQAELETSTTSAQRVAALEAYLQRTRKMEDTARAGLAQKIFTVPEVLE